MTWQMENVRFHFSLENKPGIIFIFNAIIFKSKTCTFSYQLLVMAGHFTFEITHNISGAPGIHFPLIRKTNCM